MAFTESCIRPSKATKLDEKSRLKTFQLYKAICSRRTERHGPGSFAY